MATGTLGDRQLSMLPELLRETREQGLFRVLYLHHCPIPGVEKWRKRLTDAPALEQLLREHGVELVLHGHGHRAHQHTLETADGNACVVAVPSASALGLHGADVAHYNRYHVTRTAQGWQLGIETRGFERDSGRFEAHGAREITLSRAAHS